MCVFFCLFSFFFQAEDGIRDLVRSRGLGDVYKRQVLEETESKAWQKLLSVMTHEIMNSVAPISSLANTLPVSYTHLTLPTSDLV